MKQLFLVTTCVALAVALAVPVTASAARPADAPGGGRANAPGQLKQDEASQPQAPGRSGEAPGRSGEAPGRTGGAGVAIQAEQTEDNEERGGSNGNGAEDAHVRGMADPTDAYASDDGTGTVRVRERVRVRESVEDSSTGEPRRTGIANALDRIAANLARAETQVADGSRTKVPPGLVRVFEKFLAWLGLTPDDPGQDEPAPDDGIGEPDEPAPSDEDTDTPDPVISEDPTSTPEPEGSGSE